LNGDGKPDLLTVVPVPSNEEARSIVVLLGNGDGTFVPPVAYTVNVSTYNPTDMLALGDLNGDGKLDLALAPGYEYEVAVFLGNGDGSFGSAMSYSTNATDAGSAEGIAIVDANGDGKSDVIADRAVGLGNQLQVFPGNGDGTLQAVAVFSPPTRFLSGLVAADFNGDGRVDFASADELNDNIRIFLGGALAAAPASVGTNPGAGGGPFETFTFSFSDGAGWQALGVVDVLINSALDGRQACYVAYVPQSNTLFLVDDGGDAGGPFAGSMQLTGSGSVSNSQCTVNGAASSAAGSGNTLTLTLNVAFASGFAGNKVLYLAARDTGTGNSGWQALATWDVPGGSVAGPTVSGMTPARSATTSQNYAFTFTDTNGFADLAVVDVLTNNFLDGIGACYVAFAPTSATSGYLYLVDDAGDGGYARGSPIALPSSGTLSNSQCTISAAGSSVSASGNTLTLNLAITFNSSFAGDRVFYLTARNGSGGNSGWQALGSVTVP
jgi:hypothetical protein